MRKIGVYAMIIGLALIILPYIGLTIRFLGWIDELEPIAAWSIKIGLIVLGAVLFFIGKPNTEEVVESVEESTE